MALAQLRALSPARRKLVVVVAALALLALVAAVVGIAARGEDPGTPVPQGRPGPVLLVSGYGGSTAGLQVLAAALRAAGRDARVVPPAGGGTEDLRDQASALATQVDEVLTETGAASVDLVGYSAGGVVVRLYVADFGGGSTVRRVVTLAAPHHGTDLAALGALVGSRACPLACQQLDPDSDLLRRLNAGDETPAGPLWVAVWTEDDDTVVPPESGSLEGALDFSVQSVCPGVRVEHSEVPRTQVVIDTVISVLGAERPEQPHGC